MADKFVSKYTSDEIEGILDKANNLQNYSTEEQIVGTWIDGKPIYQKTMIIENPVNDWSQLQLYSNGASIQNMETKVDQLAVMEYHNSSSDTTPAFTHSPLTYVDPGSRLVNENIIILAGRTGARFQWIGQSTRIVDRLWCTIQYTKTTD